MRSLNVLIAVVLLALCLASPAAARRPGPRLGRRKINKPTGEELRPLPENVVTVPPPERSAVDAVPIAAPEPEQPDQQQVIGRAACGAYTETNIRPLRLQWDSGNGYCGEMSLQQIAMTRGIYISQQTSRQLGVPANANHPDLLFEDREPVGGSSILGVYGVAKMLGLYQPPESYWYMDNQTLSATKQLTPGPSAFASWMKLNVIAGRPVIGGFRVRGGGYFDYDHIMPVYGICYSSTTTLANSDTFVMSDNYFSELKHTPADASFYAPFHGCTYMSGCIPNDYYDMGVAVGPLNVPSNVYFPVKIDITSWSDGTEANAEPGEGNPAVAATASYRLLVTGLTPGVVYHLYRTTGLFAGHRIPPSAAALAATCTAQAGGCRSIAFTATAASMAFNEASTGSLAGTPPLGRFPAAGVTYFLVVR